VAARVESAAGEVAMAGRQRRNVDNVRASAIDRLVE
jgi:hypothetical protein